MEVTKLLSEAELKRASFDLWKAEGGEDNQDELNRVKRLIPLILDECCTDCQRTYIMHYFADRMSMVEISKQYGVGKSTVIRTIKRGINRIYKYLKFSSPLFINAPQIHRHLQRNR